MKYIATGNMLSAALICEISITACERLKTCVREDNETKLARKGHQPHPHIHYNNVKSLTKAQAA